MSSDSPDPWPWAAQWLTRREIEALFARTKDEQENAFQIEPIELPTIPTTLRDNEMEALVEPSYYLFLQMKGKLP